MREQLRTIDQDTMVTAVIQHEKPTRIGLPKREIVVLGLAEDESVPFVQLGSDRQLSSYLEIEHLLGITYRPSKEKLKKAVESNQGVVLSEDIIGRDRLGVDRLLDGIFVDLTIEEICLSFRDGEKFAKGPFVVSSRPGEAPILIRQASGVWAPIDLSFGGEWKLMEEIDFDLVALRNRTGEKQYMGRDNG